MARTGTQIMNGPPLTYRVDIAKERLERLHDALQDADYIVALRTADSFATVFGEIVADIAQLAYNEGHSKAAIARAAGVSPSVFRGMVAT